MTLVVRNKFSKKYYQNFDITAPLLPIYYIVNIGISTIIKQLPYLINHCYIRTNDATYVRKKIKINTCLHSHFVFLRFRVRFFPPFSSKYKTNKNQAFCSCCRDKKPGESHQRILKKNEGVLRRKTGQMRIRLKLFRQ